MDNNGYRCYKQHIQTWTGLDQGPFLVSTVQQSHHLQGFREPTQFPTATDSLDLLSYITLKQVVKQKVTGLQWVADICWITDPNLQTPRYMPYLSGTLGIADQRGEIPGLKDFLLKIHPANDPDNGHANAIVSLVFKGGER